MVFENYQRCPVPLNPYNTLTASRHPPSTIYRHIIYSFTEGKENILGDEVRDHQRTVEGLKLRAVDLVWLKYLQPFWV